MFGTKHVITKGSWEVCCWTSDPDGTHLYYKGVQTLGTDYPGMPKPASSKSENATIHPHVLYSFYGFNQAFSVENKFQKDEK